MHGPKWDEERAAQDVLERSLVGHGRLLSARFQRAKDYQKELLLHEVWSNRNLLQAMGLLPCGPCSRDHDALAARLRADPAFREPPFRYLARDPCLDPPPLDALEPPVHSANATFYTSPGGGLKLTLAELRDTGRLFLDEDWIRTLCTRAPLPEAHALGLAGAPHPVNLPMFRNWLREKLRCGRPHYAAACLDAYFAGVAIRKGILPGRPHAPLKQGNLERSERAREEAQAKSRYFISQERANRLQQAEQEAALKAIQDPMAHDASHPMEAMDRKFRDRLADYQPRPDLPELTNATKPRVLTPAEQDLAQVREALKDYASRKQLADTALALAGSMAAPLLIKPPGGVGEVAGLRHGAPLKPVLGEPEFQAVTPFLGTNPPSAPNANLGLAERRAYLNNKFGRTGNLHNDITLRGYMDEVERLDVASQPGAATYYSGRGNRHRAELFTKGGGITLEQTPGGGWLDSQCLFKRMEPNQAVRPWERLSQRFAQESSGVVNVFNDGARPDGVFGRIELPALQANPKVDTIMKNGVQPIRIK